MEGQGRAPPSTRPACGRLHPHPNGDSVPDQQRSVEQEGRCYRPSEGKLGLAGLTCRSLRGRLG